MYTCIIWITWGDYHNPSNYSNNTSCSSICWIRCCSGGPVGVIVGALIGATLGTIERYINHLVYRNGVAGYDLINTTLVEGWLVPLKTIQYNLLNALFSIINFAGGNWSAGAAGAPRPSTLPSFGYAK